ncbi:glycosyltransferase family 4 protein [Aurantiacibacter poecillastricola]|uniref:glycosyltransferase family 4 protein n=1 Tax=Aurantiacibacter poecillastricola TaxID=3064385 RepID=UPI0027400420|nr:glycosyltransferase family 4 protein [Aurantiacibacter sp. 219JJ12-13]MDP5262591.1 glycosyltransferase family 4 protein [Aurantiacibacter sp. 219JJ12-13]
MSSSDEDRPGVLFVTRKWAPATGGMETYSLKLTDRLGKLTSLEIVALPGRSNGMPPGPLSLLLFPFTVLCRILSRPHAPEVLHLGDMALWPLRFLAGRKTRVVISAHGTDVAYHRRRGWRGRLYGLYLRLGARWSRDVLMIANSRATARVAAETGWKCDATIPLATDFSSDESEISNDGTILFAGRLVERKGMGWFVREVLPLLPGTLRLKVAGTGWDEAERAALDHPRVEYLGALPPAQLAAQYARSLCVIIPNIEVATGEYEGFGLVAPEAASAGGVVLAADHGGLQDAVRHGRTGLLVETGNPDAWAQAIRAISKWSAAERESFIRDARRLSREYYNWERVAEETVALYCR